MKSESYKSRSKQRTSAGESILASVLGEDIRRVIGRDPNRWVLGSLWDAGPGFRDLDTGEIWASC